MTAPAVHGALLLTQFCWGSAAVVNKLGLSGAGISPLLFALIREATASPILLALLCFTRRKRRAELDSETASDDCEESSEAPLTEGREVRSSWTNLILRLLPGLFIFLDQLCSLTGTMLADPVSAAAWQPSQVVFTVMLGVLLGMEKLTIWKCSSMVLTVIGALLLSFLGGVSHHGDGKAVQHNYQLGQLFFFVNCMSSSLEVILWRRLLKHASSEYAHLAVMAESYLVAACFMATACISVSFSPKAVDFMCPACNGDPWHVPRSALISIGYSVVFQTIIAYCAQAWALRYAPASVASFYATAQPIMAAAVTSLLLAVHFNPGGVLRWPGVELIGGAFIIAGLVVEDAGSRRAAAEDKPPDGEPSESNEDTGDLE